jgi:Helix-turn-helix domain
MSEPQWCSTTDAYAALGVTRPTVIAWLRKSILRGEFVPQGSRSVWRVERESIQEWLRTHGGPGATRGRPPGSVADVVHELQSLCLRVDALETTTSTGVSDGRRATDPPAKNELALAVVSQLLELIRSEGTEAAITLQRLASATEQLGSLLNPGD